MTLAVSHSSLQAISRCGELYRRRYVERDRTPPSVNMLVGRAVDFAVESNLGSRIEGDGPLPLDEVLSLAADSVRFEFATDAPVLDADEAAAGLEATLGHAIDKAVRLSELHWSEIAPGVDPADVGRGFEITLLDQDELVSARLIGYLDVQERDGSVRDTKTSRKSPRADAADVSQQLTIYAFAVEALDGELPPAVHLDYLVDLIKKPKAVTLSSSRSAGDFAPIMERVHALIQARQTGAFVPANPDDWWCGERFCPYWSDCRYVRRPATVAVPKNLTETLQRSLHDDTERPRHQSHPPA